MAHLNISGFGEELKELKYDNFWAWFVKVRDVRELWIANPSFVLMENMTTVGALLGLAHALHSGGRWPWLWLGAMLHGFMVEGISYMMPDVDNFWHGQTTIMFLGLRLPLYVTLLYPMFYYHAARGVYEWGMHSKIGALAFGLVVVLIDIPYDIIGIKFLYWSWHDTDPNIADRHYWVPWTSYYFHSTFAASFYFHFHLFRRLLCEKTANQWSTSKSFLRELLATLLASLMGVPGGVLLFVPLYHPLHDLYGIHSEVIYFILFVTWLLIIWSNQGKNTIDYTEKPTKKKSIWTCLLILHLVCHYAALLAISVWGNPQDVVSVGLHEPTGPCDLTQDVQTPIGKVLKKRKYLCTDDYDEGVYDFKCVPGHKKPDDYVVSYTICGTPFENRAEYISVLALIGLTAATVFWNFYANKNGTRIEKTSSAKLIRNKKNK